MTKSILYQTMTLKQFISENNISAFETVNGQLIINVIVDETSYGLDINTSKITAETPIIKYTDFVIDNDLLTVNNIVININETNILSSVENYTEMTNFKKKITLG